MIPRRHGEKGFTLVEQLAGMGVAALLLSGSVAMFANQVAGDATTKVSITASGAIGNVDRSVATDVMAAATNNLVDGAAAVDQLILSWIDWYQLVRTPHQVTYWLSGTDLKRDYDGTISTVARSISSIAFSRSGQVVTIVVACTPPWSPPKTVQRTLRVWLRPAP